MGFISLFPNTVTSNTNLDISFDIYRIDASGGNITLTLPNIVIGGGFLILRRSDGSANTVTLQGFTPSQTINGSVSITIPPSTTISVIALNFVWITY